MRQQQLHCQHAPAVDCFSQQHGALLVPLLAAHHAWQFQQSLHYVRPTGVEHLDQERVSRRTWSPGATHRAPLAIVLHVPVHQRMAQAISIVPARREYVLELDIPPPLAHTVPALVGREFEDPLQQLIRYVVEMARAVETDAGCGPSSCALLLW